MNRKLLPTLIFATALCAAPAVPANSSIGVATAVSAFSVNDSMVTGTANLFDGTVLQTERDTERCEPSEWGRGTVGDPVCRHDL